jgi:rod shape determining protein RodA
MLVLPIIGISYFLVSEASSMLANKQIVYFTVGFLAFFFFFLFPIRKLEWLLPLFYWMNIALLVSVEFFGVSRLGAKRWLEIPFVHFTVQPSEIMKPALVLMLAYLIKQNPPDEEGYGLKAFAKLSFYIILPFVLIAKEPDLGTALVLLIVGYGMLFVIGVNKKIWFSIIIAIGIAGPFMYNNLHGYQKQRISDFISEKPSYHVRQSLIAIGSGGLTGKERTEATQTHFKFLPIATSDFIFAYHTERFGFLGALGLVLLYAFLILHLLTLTFKLKNDYFAKSIITSVALLIFIYMGVNISMTIGFAPVVGVPLPFFSYGGSSFITFMIFFGIVQNLLAFRFDSTYRFVKFNL